VTGFEWALLGMFFAVTFFASLVGGIIGAWLGLWKRPAVLDTTLMLAEETPKEYARPSLMREVM
jgi:hypothetical protein